MGYESNIVAYSWPIAGTTAKSRVIKGPKGKSGRIIDVVIDCDVAFVGTTTPTIVRIENGESINVLGTTYAAQTFNFATVTAGTAGTPLSTTTCARASDGGLAPSDTVAGILYAHELPADTAISMNVVAGVGGTVAGNGTAHLLVAWY